jgi:hypothetical protein
MKSGFKQKIIFIVKKEEDVAIHHFNYVVDF